MVVHGSEQGNKDESSRHSTVFTWMDGGNRVEKYPAGKGFDNSMMVERAWGCDKRWEIDDSAIVYQVQMVDLESKEGKTARLVSVD